MKKFTLDTEKLGFYVNQRDNKPFSLAKEPETF